MTVAAPAGRRVELALMRGGTSRGVFLRAGVLAADRSVRDAQIVRLLGSGTPGQVDGLGGAAQTSKLVVIGPPSAAGADADYTFMQVGIDEPVVDMSGTCLNLSAAGMLFARQSGLAPVPAVVLHNTNTGELLRGEIHLDDETDGWSSQARVLLDLSAMLPDTRAALLPTGRESETLTLADGREVTVSLLGIGNPTVFVTAADLGVDGHRAPADLEHDESFVRAVEEIREWGRLRLVDHGFAVLARTPTRLPLVAVVAPPDAPAMDLQVRLWAVGRVHRAIAASAAIATATIADVEGSVVASLLGGHRHRDQVTVGHPSGSVVVRLGHDQAGTLRRLSLERTARRLLDGVAYI